MANVTREQFLQLLKQAPQGTTPEALRDKLLERGNTLVGYTPQDSLSVIQKQQQEGKRGIGGFLLGAVKGAASTISNISSLGQKGLEKITGVQSETPTMTEYLGDTIKPQGTAEKIGFGTEQVGEFFVPGGAASKAGKAVEVLNQGKNISKFVSGGTKLLAKAGTEAVTSSALTAMQGGNSQDVKTAGVVGAALPILGSGLSALYKKVFPTQSIEKAVGQIAQGKTKDIPVFKRALDLVNTKGVKTYEDLQGKFKEIIPQLAQQVDNELLKDNGIYNLKQLSLSAKNKAGKEITTDYVSRALNQLSELYSKVGDDVAKSNIDDTLIKAQTDGLTRQEVNNISRIYGVEFGKKAFGKLGEALTSVNAQAFENTRKGLKSVARQGLNGETAKALDSKLSDIYDAQALTDKMVESVNALKQKVEERGILEKTGRQLSTVANLFTGNTLKGFITGLFPSNVGNKALNSIAIEELLKKNLAIVNKALEAKSDSEFIKILQTLGKAVTIKASTRHNQSGQ